VSLGLKFSADSRQVMFRENSYSSDHLRYVTLRALDMESGESRVIVENTRSLQGIDLQSDMAIAVDNGRLRSRSLTTNSVSATAVAPVVSIDHGQLCITENGATRILSPMGTDGQSYLWPEVSPDGKKIVFYLAATGCFVCNIDGSDCHHIGTIRAARWMGNDMIVGMYDQDNGVNVTASELIASNAAGTVKQTLTDSSVMAMFPSPSVAAGKIAFTTPQGELYIMTVE
jgi:hypothetical protein